MRVRKMDATGDMVFGGNQSSFWVDAPDAVAQVVGTRLRLWQGEWFLDATDGTPWMQSVLGAGKTSTYDAAIRARILGTTGANSMLSYSSVLDGRSLTVTATIDTNYGSTAAVTQTF